MSSTPIIRQISWVALIPQLTVLAICVAIGLLIKPRDGLIWGAGAFLAYSVTSRLLITHDHRAGIRFVKRQGFSEAISCFERSLAFFDRHSWIDQWRSIILMSASAISYREMALANIAFCYSQLGDGHQACQYYEKCLERFPDSGLAMAALRMMNSVK